MNTLNTSHPYDLIIGLDRSDKKADLCLITTATGQRRSQTIDTAPEALWETVSPVRSIIRPLLLLGLSLAIGFVAIDYLIENGAYLRNFQQSWTSHFGALKSTEYGSPDDYPFDWRIFLKNWDTAIPALLGVVFCIRQIRKAPMTIFPLALFALTLLVFTIHRPWWPYYYIHITIPLCWCAAVGIEAVRQRISPKRTRVLLIVFSLYVICALTWMGARVYLQIRDIRNSAQTYSSLVLTQIERYKPSTEWMYADKPIYSFHSGIPLPPPLAVVMLKRLWSGEMTNQCSNCRGDAEVQTGRDPPGQ